MMKTMQIALVLTALDRASAPVKGVSAAVAGIGKAADVVVAKLARVQAKLKGMAESSEQFGRKSAMTGALTVAAVGKVMEPFEELEDATTRMGLAYTNAQGKATKYFELIKRQTVELGNELPGTTKDFTQLATSLKEAGLAEDSISKGGLKAAGYLRTIFDEHDSKKVAEVVAGSLHAFNLKDDSLVKYIDIMQRAHYAFGMTLDDFKYGLPYIARSYGLLNPKGGLQAAKSQTILMGMLRQGGMEGSMVGESIGSFYSHLAMQTTRMKYGKGQRGLLSVAGDILKKYHTDLSLYDQKGSYIGDKALMEKIWLLKKRGAKPEELGTIGQSIAGAVGSTMFTKLSLQGPEGYAKAEEALRDQQNLTEKIARLLKTLKNVKEAGMGTVTNLAATVGGALAPSLKSFFDRLNDVTGKLQVFFEAQEKGNTTTWKLTKFLLLGTLALGVLGIGVGAGALAFSAMARPVVVLIALLGNLHKVALLFRATQSVGMFGELITGASPAILWLGKVSTAFKTATLASKAFMLANPFGVALIAILAVVAATAQLIKHWDTLKQPGFWKDLRGWVGSGFGTIDHVVKSQESRGLTPATIAREAREQSQGPGRASVVLAKLAVSGTPSGLNKKQPAQSGAIPMNQLAVSRSTHSTTAVTYSPQVTISGASPTAAADFAGMLRAHSEDLMRIMAGNAAQQQRRAF